MTDSREQLEADMIKDAAYHIGAINLSTVRKYLDRQAAITRDEQTALANEYRKKALGYYCELRNQELGCEYEDCFLCDAVFDVVDIND